MMSSSTTLQECIGGDNTLAIQCLASAMDTAAAGLDSTVDEVVFDINDLKGKSTNIIWCLCKPYVICTNIPLSSSS